MNIFCPISNVKNCKMGCCSKSVTPRLPNSKIGINCQSCNAATMDPWLWGQTIQQYPLPNIPNNIYFGNLAALPTAYGSFLAYTKPQWETGRIQKLESHDWRIQRGYELGPGTLV